MMIELSFTRQMNLPLHVADAISLCNTAMQYGSAIHIVTNRGEICVKTIMQLVTIPSNINTLVDIKVSGTDSKCVTEDIANFMEEAIVNKIFG